VNMDKNKLDEAAHKIAGMVSSKTKESIPIGPIKEVVKWLNESFGLGVEDTAQARAAINSLNSRGSAYEGGPGRLHPIGPEGQFMIVDFGGWQNVRDEDAEAEPLWHIMHITDGKKRRFAELREMALLVAAKLKKEAEEVLGEACDPTLDPENLDVTLRTTAKELYKFAKLELNAAENMSERALLVYRNDDATALIEASGKPLKRLQAMANELKSA